MSEKGFFNRSLYELWKDRQAAETASATSSMNSKMKKMAEQNEELIELMKENAGKMQAEAVLKQEENAKEIKRLREELDKLKDDTPMARGAKRIVSAEPVVKIELGYQRFYNIVAAKIEEDNNLKVLGYLSSKGKKSDQVVGGYAKRNEDGSATLTIMDNEEIITAKEIDKLLNSPISRIANSPRPSAARYNETNGIDTAVQIIDRPEVEEDRIPISDNLFGDIYITKVTPIDGAWEITGFGKDGDKPEVYFKTRTYNDKEINKNIVTLSLAFSDEKLQELKRKTDEKYAKKSNESCDAKNGQYILKMLKYLRDNDALYDTKTVERIKARKKGKVYTLDAHVRAMVYSLLSAETPWERIEPNLEAIDRIFGNYDPEFVKNQDPEKFVEEIRTISCGNRNIKRQMEALKYNIEVFEKLEDKYGSMDACINELGFGKVVKMLADYESQYKLKMMHIALVSEYLRWMGVDGAKPDGHLCRFLGSARMGAANVSAEATPNEVFAQIDELAEETGLYKIEIDNIIWSFCADGYGEVCTATPHCEKCPIREFCKYKG